ncbi:MAG: glycosyltransferase family 4 protein [Rhodothermia bacterium]
MRILTVLRELGAGGTQRVAQNYSLGYQDAGHDVAVLGYEGGGPRAAQLEKKGLPVFRGGTDPEQRAAAVKLAAAWQPDIVHVHREGRANTRSAQVLRRLKASRSSRLPVIETNVFARVDYSPDRDLIDAHLLLTKWCLWKWRRWSRKIRPRPVGVVVPYAIDAVEFYPPAAHQTAAFRQARGIPPDAFVFGRIGQPGVSKWSPVIFDAFARLARDQHAFLMLVGLPEELRPAVQQLDTAVRERVIEVPFTNDDAALRAAYGAMDVFVHAAHIGESFGMVLVESMLCGTPVITLSTPRRDNSQLEVVGHEEGGLVVTDANTMTTAMERLMHDGALRTELSEQGVERTRNRYSIEHVVPGLLNVVNHVAAASTPAELRTALDRDESLITEIEDREIRALLGRSLGAPSLADRIVMNVVHQPRLYRAWSNRKFGQ